MLRKSLPLFAVFSVALAAGCASKQEVREDQVSTQGQAQTQAPGTGGMMCPLQVPGVKVESATTDNGAAMVFTTTEKDQVDELRKRVGAMAEMHNRMHAGGAPAAGAPPAPSAVPSCPAAQARVENVDGGARIVLTPTDPANLEAVRAHVQHRAAMMQQSGKCPMAEAGKCPMMKGEGKGCPHCAHGAPGAGGQAQPCPKCPHAAPGGQAVPAQPCPKCPHAAPGGQAAPAQPCPHCGPGGHHGAMGPGAAPGAGGCQCGKAPGGCQCGQAPGGCKCGMQQPPKQP